MGNDTFRPRRQDEIVLGAILAVIEFMGGIPGYHVVVQLFLKPFVAVVESPMSRFGMSETSLQLFDFLHMSIRCLDDSNSSGVDPAFG